MIIDRLHELLDREPFEPFRVVTSSGEAYTVHNAHLVALMKSQVFIAQPRSDKSTFVSLLHITAIETLQNGGSAARRGRRH